MNNLDIYDVKINKYIYDSLIVKCEIQQLLEIENSF